jgi:hypothetical protein
MVKWIGSLVLMITVLHSTAGNTDTIAVYSPAMHKSIPCVVITPADYETGGNRYPVLYLLHGYGGSYANGQSWRPNWPAKWTNYTERPGAHNNAYWKNSIDYQLVFFRKFFDGL